MTEINTPSRYWPIHAEKWVRNGLMASQVHTEIRPEIPPILFPAPVPPRPKPSAKPNQHLLTLKELDSDTRAFFSPALSERQIKRRSWRFRRRWPFRLRNTSKRQQVGSDETGGFAVFGSWQYKSVYTFGPGSALGSVYIRPVPIGSKVSETDAIDTKDNLPPLSFVLLGFG